MVGPEAGRLHDPGLDYGRRTWVQVPHHPNLVMHILHHTVLCLPQNSTAFRFAEHFAVCINVVVMCWCMSAGMVHTEELSQAAARV